MNRARPILAAVFAVFAMPALAGGFGSVLPPVLDFPEPAPICAPDDSCPPVKNGG